MKTIFNILLVIIFAFQANAQLGGFKKKLGLGGGGAEKATLSAEEYANQLGQSLVDVSKARIEFVDAQIKFSQALGLKKEMVQKLTEAKNALEGASDPDARLKAIKDSTKVTEGAYKESSKAMETSKELSAESKIIFGKGVGHMIKGASAEKKQIEVIKNLVDQGQSMVQASSPLKKAGVIKLIKPAKDLFSIVPGDLKAGFKGLKQGLSFAKKQKITVPDEEGNLEELDELDEL